MLSKYNLLARKKIINNPSKRRELCHLKAINLPSVPKKFTEVKVKAKEKITEASLQITSITLSTACR
jgi:septation ring formation regulator EzrA